MARRTARPKPTRQIDLPALTRACPECGGPPWAAYKTRRTAITLDRTVRLGLQVRRCRDRQCPRFGTPWRPEEEGRIILPQHEFGLDVVAAIGRLRHAEHRSLPEIHAELTRRGVPICVRSVGNLLDRYDELLALSLSDVARLRRLTAAAGRVILALDGLQPDVGHEVLWVIRDVISAARSCWPGACSPPTQADLAKLDRRGQGRPGGADRRRDLRRPALDPQGRRRGPCPACPTSSASSTTSARRPCRSTRPIAMPRSCSRRRSAASGRSSGSSRVATTRRRRRAGGTAPRCGRR